MKETRRWGEGETGRRGKGEGRRGDGEKGASHHGFFRSPLSPRLAVFRFPRLLAPDAPVV